MNQKPNEPSTVPPPRKSITQLTSNNYHYNYTTLCIHHCTHGRCTQPHTPSNYQSYHYASTTNQTHSAPFSITYFLPPPHITYLRPSTQNHQTKTEPNTLPPPPAQQQEPPHHGSNFLIYGTIHTITGGSNLNF
jgi:hypothetical protein